MNLKHLQKSICTNHLRFTKAQLQSNTCWPSIDNWLLLNDVIVSDTQKDLHKTLLWNESPLNNRTWLKLKFFLGLKNLNLASTQKWPPRLKAYKGGWEDEKDQRLCHKGSSVHNYKYGNNFEKIWHPWRAIDNCIIPHAWWSIRFEGCT
jgi:hypothetical protein